MPPNQGRTTGIRRSIVFLSITCISGAIIAAYLLGRYQAKRAAREQYQPAPRVWSPSTGPRGWKAASK